MSKDEEEEQSRGFKVADRRRFVDREDDAPDEAPDQAPAQTPGQDEAVSAGTGASAESQPSDAAEPPPASEQGAAAGGPLPEMTFSTFVISLMTQALMHLGEIVQEGHQPTRDLPAAKQMIDLLGILREKTTGNLDANEEQLLGNMLYDLRMRYVEVSRGG